MSWINAIFNVIGGGPKVYRSTIEKIPGNRFSRQVSLDIKGQKTVLVDYRLRDYLARLAGGGITLTSLEKKLKDLGLKDSQYQRRKEIMGIIKGEVK